jgi:predicted DNA-binding transcriptional regulator AlpA
MPKTQADDRWLTVEELAARFRVPRKTVHAWNYTRYGPRGVRFGRRILYRESEVLRWERERELAA